MNVTKYEHACMVVNAGSSRLVIDPGSFLASLPDASGTAAIVLTHEHADHFSPDNVHRIIALNPDVRIFGPQGVADAASAHGITVEVMRAGDSVDVSPFTLRFFGGRHNEIHSSIPIIDNLGVLVNDTLYYPGDSYTVPDTEVDVLAAPLGAPWLKISEAMDYVLAVKPRRAFPVHDMTLSVIGKRGHAERLAWATAQNGGEFTVLEPGEVIEL